MALRGGRGSIIVGRGIEKHFQLGEEDVQALKAVNLDIPAGQFISIMGPSGSGKSTLLYMLGGLDRPSAGDIYVAGQDISHMSGEDLAAFRRDTIGFIFQAFHLVPTNHDSFRRGILKGRARRPDGPALRPGPPRAALRHIAVEPGRLGRQPGLRPHLGDPVPGGAFRGDGAEHRALAAGGVRRPDQLLRLQDPE